MTRIQEITISASKRLSLIAVVGCAIAAITVLLSAGWQTLRACLDMLTGAATPKEGVILLVLSVDQFLIATVFYVVSLGLYQLIVDQSLPLLEWQRIRNLDDLKSKLLRLAAVVIAIDFVAEVARWSGDASILPFGASIALVIAALTLFLKVSSSTGPK